MTAFSSHSRVAAMTSSAGTAVLPVSISIAPNEQARPETACSGECLRWSAWKASTFLPPEANLHECVRFLIGVGRGSTDLVIPDPVLAPGDHPGAQSLDEELCSQFIDCVQF